MRKLILVFLIGLTLFFGVFPGIVLAKNFTEKFENGIIDWSNGIAEAVGIGVPPARPINSAQARAIAESTSVTSARSNLRNILYNVQIDSGRHLRDFIVQSQILGTKLETLLKNARVVDVSYMSDGSVNTRIAITLTGSFADLVLPRSIRTIEPVQQPQVNNHEGKRVFTGLVVDCRGFRVAPAMVPSIVDEDGKEVYGSAFVSRDHAVKQGMVLYTKGVQSAKPNARVADKPLAVKGIRTAQTGISDIVVSNADAAKIRGSASNLGFLQKCRVVIVLD